jgi:hypothetical protein
MHCKRGFLIFWLNEQHVQAKWYNPILMFYSIIISLFNLSILFAYKMRVALCAQEHYYINARNMAVCRTWTTYLSRIENVFHHTFKYCYRKVVVQLICTHIYLQISQTFQCLEISFRSCLNELNVNVALCVTCINFITAKLPWQFYFINESISLHLRTQFT